MLSTIFSMGRFFNAAFKLLWNELILLFYSFAVLCISNYQLSRHSFHFKTLFSGKLLCKYKLVKILQVHYLWALVLAFHLSFLFAFAMGANEVSNGQCVINHHCWSWNFLNFSICHIGWFRRNQLESGLFYGHFSRECWKYATWWVIDDWFIYVANTILTFNFKY